MNNNVAEARKQEAEMDKVLAKLKALIIEEIEAAGPMDGVTITSDRLAAGTVSFSALRSNLNISPSTYLPKAQAEVVRKKLEPKKRVTDVIHTLEQMLEDEYVKLSDGERVTLNEKTLEAIRKILEEK